MTLVLGEGSIRHELFIYLHLNSKWAFLIAQQVKNLPTMQEAQEMRFDPWVKKILSRRKMATHFGIFLPEKSQREVSGQIQSIVSQRVGPN